MTQNLRVKSSEFIDETNRISFKFDGKTYYGFKGDTLASALIANNIHLVGRSFKYHRPRGIMTSGSEEPNAIVQVNPNSNITEPNARATEIEIYEGLEASSQNCWPSVNFDIGGINNLLAPLFPAGFYYKTFMWPKSFWEKYEFFIRHSAGLGKSPNTRDPDIYDHRYIHCDVLVVGAGISGILAARNAAKNNFKTLLLDEKNELGGSTIFEANEDNKINNNLASEWLKKEINELKNIKNLEIKTRTSVAAYHQYNYLLARENLTDHLEKKDKKNKIRQRLLKIRAKNSNTDIEKKWLEKKYKQYGVRQNDLSTLKIRMDEIPVSLSIAQAAKETGWGTSRFALKGNALFGQWTWSGEGLKPKNAEKGEEHKVMKFHSLQLSVRAYLRNLNTHSSYKNLRKARTMLRNSNKPLDSLVLSNHLDKYAETGTEYIEVLQKIIKQNNLKDFDEARLLPSSKDLESLI